MPKRWTDAEFEVVRGSKPDVLPQWFKTMMYVLAALFMLTFIADKYGAFPEFHDPTDPRPEPVPAVATTSPQAPPAQ